MTVLFVFVALTNYTSDDSICSWLSLLYLIIHTRITSKHIFAWTRTIFVLLLHNYLYLGWKLCLKESDLCWHSNNGAKQTRIRKSNSDVVYERGKPRCLHLSTSQHSSGLAAACVRALFGLFNYPQMHSDIGKFRVFFSNEGQTIIYIVPVIIN